MKTHCDFYCAEANDCMVGGVRCERCGERFCATQIGEEGICPDCAKARREAETEAEDAEEELGDLCHED